MGRSGGGWGRFQRDRDPGAHRLPSIHAFLKPVLSVWCHCGLCCRHCVFTTSQAWQSLRQFPSTNCTCAQCHSNQCKASTKCSRFQLGLHASHPQLRTAELALAHPPHRHFVVVLFGQSDHLHTHTCIRTCM